MLLLVFKCKQSVKKNRIFFKIHGKFLQVSFRAGRDWDRKGVAAQKTQGKKIFIIIGIVPNP